MIWWRPYYRLEWRTCPPSLPRTQHDQRNMRPFGNIIFSFLGSYPEDLPPQTVGMPFHGHSGQLSLVRVSLDVVGNVMFSDCIGRTVPLNIRFWFLGVWVLVGVVKLDGMQADLIRNPREVAVPLALCSSIRALESLLTSRCSQHVGAVCAKTSPEGASL